MKEARTIGERLALTAWLGTLFGASVGMRVVSRTYQGADLGLEGAFIAGAVGGYICGLCSGVLIALPAVLMGEHLTLPFLAGIGVLGGLLRDCAPDSEDVWRLSPFFELNIYRFFKESRNPRRTAFQLVLFASVLFAEFMRAALGSAFPKQVFYLAKTPEFGSAAEAAGGPHPLTIAAMYLTTLLAVAIPLKIWNSARNEKKLEEQERLLAEARLAALTSQINPHFLFNTLNSVSSLIRSDPSQARVMVMQLSKVLRRLLRKHGDFTPLRDELSFIDDYLSIELVRFGEKLRFEKDVAEDTLDMPVPSMLLQPLVENSIKHGLSSKVEGGTIRIRTYRVASKLHVEVSDDGVGIAESKLANLLEHGIGVSNVNERLKVLFGGEYRMFIESRPGEGTNIKIEVPEIQTELPVAAAAIHS